jgi:MoaA/NifB/PqqE/SkfB family radical SAM enzyme/polysaccharide pyruvyl transferase WcaK-like protein
LDKNIKNKLRIFKKLFLLWKSERFPREKFIKVETINLNANDFCNSKCTMCNIWKQKKSYEISYDDLEKIFSDSFYSEIKHVGITGGEPTLRGDLPDLFKACIDFLPNLKGLSIITNCIKQDDVKNHLKNIDELCKNNGVSFTVMVSLDGVDEVHDKIRGVKGNFKSTLEVIRYVREDLNIPILFGATISKENVWEMDELLDYAKDNNLYGRFRVAEFIKRLYNDDRNEVIRNFNDDEKYQLVLFFEKLKRTFEWNSTFNRTYSSIQNILLGGKRTIGCPYHKNGVLLSSKGEIAYCAPKSKIIGNALKKSTLKIYNENLNERKRILQNDCKDCIHDYHAPITFKEQLKIEKDKILKDYLNIQSSYKVVSYSMLLTKPLLPRKKYSILIVGWYGTETVGDKAILGGIILQYKKKYGNQLNIVIASLHPFITKKTLDEIKFRATIVNSASFEFLKYSKYCNEVIMGGGPLMDINELYVPLMSFAIAKKYNRKRTVFGCGIGPISQDIYKNAIRDILNFSSEVKLRDFKSKEYAEKNFSVENIQMIGDPAEKYISFINETIKPNKKKNELSLFLRDLTYEYSRNDLTNEEFTLYKSSFENALANLIKQKALEFNVESIRFNHMHNFVIGNDDRDFSRRFINKYFPNDLRVSFESKLSTVETVVEAMKSSKVNICMRFHSVLFAKKLGVEFIAVDYTQGGKIHAFMSQNDCLELLITIPNLIEK